MSEQANRGSMGIMLSCMGGSCNLAYGLAATVVWLMRLCCTEHQMILWGWRVPFLLSAVPAYFCLSRLSQMEVLARSPTPPPHPAHCTPPTRVCVCVCACPWSQLGAASSAVSGALRVSCEQETKEFKQLGLDEDADALEVMEPSRTLDDTVEVFRHYGDRVLLCFFALAGQAAMWCAPGHCGQAEGARSARGTHGGGR